MKKEINLHGDKYTAYSPDDVNWVCVAKDCIIIPELPKEVINNYPNCDIYDAEEISNVISYNARDGIVGCINALGLKIAAPLKTFKKTLLKNNIEFYKCSYFDNDYYVRTKIDKSKSRLSYYFYKDRKILSKLKKFNDIMWISEDLYE
ncbi:MULTISPECIES: hypothetical protein [Bacteria]|uniref:hypothetical protein n=1 Tax=Bacteria TaxID=2 RepID=UPI00126A33F7|nr:MULTISPECIES: hypothetical protein [Bacteria]